MKRNQNQNQNQNQSQSLTSEVSNKHSLFQYSSNKKSSEKMTRKERQEAKNREILNRLNKDQETANDFLERGEIKKLILFLGFLKSLEQFLKHTNYSIFNWALEHEELALLEFLAKKVRPEYHLLVISHNDYRAVKSFIDRTLELGKTDYDLASARKQKILELIQQMDSQLPTVMQDEISAYESQKKNQLDQKTKEAFKNDIYQACSVDMKSESSSFSL